MLEGHVQARAAGATTGQEAARTERAGGCRDADGSRPARKRATGSSREMPGFDDFAQRVFAS